MNIPMEHFSTVPVVLLSPSIMATPEDEVSNSFTRSLVIKMREAEGILNRDSPGASVSSEDDRGSLTLEPKTPTASRAARVMHKLKAGNQMVVCHDCKRMVLQIIQSARVNRSAIRNKTIQNMTLNLSPIF